MGGEKNHNNDINLAAQQELPTSTGLRELRQRTRAPCPPLYFFFLYHLPVVRVPASRRAAAEARARSAAKLPLSSLHFLSSCRQHPQLRQPSPAPPLSLLSLSLCLTHPPPALQPPPCRPRTSDARREARRKESQHLEEFEERRKKEEKSSRSVSV